MKPYGIRKKDKNPCPCCGDKYHGNKADKARKAKERQPYSLEKKYGDGYIFIYWD